MSPRDERKSSSTKFKPLTISQHKRIMSYSIDQRYQEQQNSVNNTQKYSQHQQNNDHGSHEVVKSISNFLTLSASKYNNKRNNNFKKTPTEGGGGGGGGGGGPSAIIRSQRKSM